jgi:hypothetical protein
MNPATDLARPIIEWFHRHGVVHTAEPSFKISQGALNCDRQLFGFNKTQLGPYPDRTLLDFCRRLDMPPEMLAQYQEVLPQTGYVGFGHETSGEVKRYKAYLDLSSRAGGAAQRLLSSNDSELQFLGFKWTVTGDSPPVLTEYRWFPLLSRHAMRRRGLELLGNLTPARAVLEAAFMVCARDWPTRPLEYMEAREPGNPRISFDIKFYSTSFRLASITPELLNLGAQLGLGQSLQTLLEASADSRLGHLAGGLDRSGTPCFMVYHGVQRRISPVPTDEKSL